MLKYITEHKKLVAAAVIIPIILIVPFLFNHKTAQAPEVIQVPAVTEQHLHQYFPMESQASVKDMAKQINQAQERVPAQQFYTYTQQAADKKAQDISKEKKADKLVKETKEKPIVDETGKETGEKVIQNNYYGINLERKHKVKVGAATIDKDIYMSVGYQNRDVEYTAYYSPIKKSVGVGVEVTVAKW